MPAFFEAVFVDREVVFAPARARPLPPRDLEAAAFAGVSLPDDAALFFDARLLDAVAFLEAARLRSRAWRLARSRAAFTGRAATSPSCSA
jgi:hypothetical protein